MKITRIDQFSPAPRTRLVRIATDTGIEGWSEGTLEGKPFSVPAAVSEYADYLLGKDPLLIEHHWQQMYRSAFFRGGRTQYDSHRRLDAALWDVAGKHYGVPSYALMGGKVRDKIRVYAHWGIDDLTDEGLEQSRSRLMSYPSPATRPTSPGLEDRFLGPTSPRRLLTVSSSAPSRCASGWALTWSCVSTSTAR